MTETLEQEKQDIKAAQAVVPKFPYYRIDEKTGEPVEITRKEYKEYMRKHFTVKHSVIPQCRHAFVPGTEPRKCNCESCWFTFFQVHGELTQAVEELFQKHGKQPIIVLRGKKFFDNWLKFMATVAAFKAAVEAEKESNGEETSPV